MAPASPSTSPTAAPDSPAPAGSPDLVLPELLAPAGDWECIRAAVENGADAVYFGLDRFNARMRARNFTVADLPELLAYLHRRGVRGYVTFNTLVFADELAGAADYLESLIAAGVDAVIVQDVGICRLIRRLSPDFPIHGSTQMTVTSSAGVDLARTLGCDLVVLARENSLREIATIQADLSARPDGRLPLEVFVHGALCVAYSGQCLTSEALGGRSANRGECAQACRLPYDLISDGRKVDLGDRRYLLSPQDLAGLDVLPDLVRSGVASLKIEGRLKAPEYVAGITRVYRAALDRLRETGLDGHAVQPRSRYELEMAFSRGLHTGWFRGIDNQALAHARFGKKRGVFLGEVLEVGRDRVAIRPVAPVQPGDGVVFDAGRPDQAEEGGRVYGVTDAGPGRREISFGRGAVDPTRIRPGDRLWKTDDPALGRELRRTFEGDSPRHTRPVTARVHGSAGTPLTLELRDETGREVRVASHSPLLPADRQPLTDGVLSAQLGRLGGTPFRLAAVENLLDGSVLLPLGELNRLRREAVAALLELRARPPRWIRTNTGAADAIRVSSGAADPAPDEPVELCVLVRNPAQLEAALVAGTTTLYCEFEDPKRYREAVQRFHTAFGCSTGPAHTSPSIWVAPPRITKPGEEWILRQVRSSDADGFLVRNADHLAFFADCRRRGDFPLNVANPLTAEFYLRQVGLERVTASYDLNADQLEALLRGAPPGWFEVTIHQHMPMFHMEHCVFCAFLSSGHDYRDCGRPCERHDVRLQDRVGMEHPLKADAGCRNTVFNARAQTGAEAVPRLLGLGLRRFRVEFVNEGADEVTRTIARYRALLRGEITGEDLWRELRLQNQLGVTRGQLEQAEGRQVFPGHRRARRQ